MVIMRKVIAVSTAGLVAICSTMGFEPPGPQQRLQAIGPTNGLPEVLQLAFTPDDDFTPVPAPGPDDWLTAHGESGQTFEQFRNSRPNRPDAQRRVLYLQPLGAFPEGQSPPIEKLRDYTAAIFQMEVKLLAPWHRSASRGAGSPTGPTQSPGGANG